MWGAYRDTVLAALLRAVEGRVGGRDELDLRGRVGGQSGDAERRSDADLAAVRRVRDALGNGLAEPLGEPRAPSTVVCGRITANSSPP